MKGCVSSYTKYFQKNEMNTTRIILYETGSDTKWKSILDEFLDKEAILINFLSGNQTESVAKYISDKKLNITTISFQEISSVDLSKFPAVRDPDGKYSFYVASQIISLDINKDTKFKESYENILLSKATTAPTTETTATAPPGPNPPITIAVDDVQIDDFTTDEKI